MDVAAEPPRYDPGHIPEVDLIAVTDPLPDRVRRFVRGQDEGRELLEDTHRHVASATRSYPDAYFALGRRTPDALVDLAHRVFTTCARVSKGRFPFLDRTPFATYVAERFDGRAIRYHSFYAKLSITREILRADYEHNLASHPALRWRANLYRDIGLVLRRIAVSPSGGSPVRWSIPARGLAAMVPPEHLAAGMRKLGTRDLEPLIRDALTRGGPLTQAQLTWIIEMVLPAPEIEEAPESANPDVVEHLGVRQAVLGAWHALGEEDRELLACIAEGLQYDEIVRRHPRFKHKVAVNRAVAKLMEGFVGAIATAAGAAAPAGLAPAGLAEAVLEVLLDGVPELRERLSAAGGST